MIHIYYQIFTPFHLGQPGSNIHLHTSSCSWSCNQFIYYSGNHEFIGLKIHVDILDIILDTFVGC